MNQKGNTDGATARMITLETLARETLYLEAVISLGEVTQRHSKAVISNGCQHTGQSTLQPRHATTEGTWPHHDLQLHEATSWAACSAHW